MPCLRPLLTALLVASIPLATLGCSDGDGSGSVTFSGKWEQFACSDNTGKETTCIVALTDATKRIIEFTDGGSKAKLSTKGLPGAVATSTVKGKTLCPPIINVCFPIDIVAGSLVYCVSPALCEKLKSIP